MLCIACLLRMLQCTAESYSVWLHVLQIVMFPSKGDSMFVCESLIFRSDSNGEDLEGYAGAGLYDSVTMDPTVVKKVDYNSDR